ncbi:restriction endonuclease subunit S [Fictibacillus enclensis]|uniref:restriction endonuclease subunit S n=1 Tax=Fictibacillus enclensis TaxID=1017270 RepID=UPI0025A219B9|nr:restriction endonuclease subunit S [Fictibacillus enclensis]MDM5335737.1 restriction endonuclease subunit S [Fictibacillus enclensis]
MTNKFTPEIRFPGFSSNWKQQKIGDYLNESRIPGTNGLKAKKLTVKLWGKGVVPKDEVYKGSEATKYYIRKAGQFIYGKLDFLHQAFGIIPDELNGYESTLDSPAFDIADNLNSSFFYEYVSRKKFYKYQGTLANGSRKAKRIHSETFLEMPLVIPDVEEQNNIGNFFKNIDDTIALHQQEINILKQIKQGFLQNIFPKEGESVPGVRFPEFTSDWKVRKLKDIVDLLKDGTHGTHKDGEDAFLLSAKNIKNGQIIIDEITDRKISSFDYNSIFKNYKLMDQDLLVTIVGTIGQTALYTKTISKLAFQRSVAIIRGTKEVNQDFLKSTFESNYVQKQLKQSASMSAQAGVYLGDLGKFTINIPELSEQIKIGKFFKRLDDVIALHQREFEALNSTKKAFLEKMFV